MDKEEKRCSDDKGMSRTEFLKVFGMSIHISKDVQMSFPAMGNLSF
jgi:hypothetical protein